MDDKREVIELINKLQGYRTTTGCEINIQLPQIVVVGAQSSGKSSVLDGLVGRSILPRGSGTVTKCPIIVQLFTTPDADKEGVEFQDAPDDGRIKDYDVVRAMITERMESGGGAIKDDPIIIKVFSPNVVTLTVVDLPGIKRLTTYGEPDNLEKLIFALSRKYINEKNAIILAVSPANYDICNSDGILLAKEADPSGDRTIGVLTKLDLMDQGTSARKLLTGTSDEVKVKLGMIGLVNRSQRDIDNNLSVEEQLQKEKAFLEQEYTDLAEKNGVPYLRTRLHELLVHHILKCLPEIQSDMEELLKKCQVRIDDIPDVTTRADKYRYVSRIIQGLETSMKTEIEGSTRNPGYQHLYGGIKIKDAFEKKFAKDMDIAGKKTDKSITDDMILTAFRNSGSFDSFFVYPEAVFRKLAQEQVKHLEEPALKCAERVYDEIVKIGDRYLHAQQHAFNLFPDLRKTLKSVVYGMLNSKLEEVKMQIKDYIRIQASVVFSLDQAFSEKVSQLRRKLEKNLHGHYDSSDSGNEGGDEGSQTNFDLQLNMLPRVPEKSTSIKKTFSLSNDGMFQKLKNPSTIKLIKEMVNLYFHHIKMQTQDYIPKLVADRLITQFSSDDGNLGEELRIHVMENYYELVLLPLKISERRAKDVFMKEHLKEVISEIKGILSANKYIDEESGYSDHIASDDEDL